ncbi:hypothetical protein AVEN_241034-1 [Araneus ventricosus]|uniref:Uncharacterized protein n=1 Tax=Araneus ventricosus TaxID=182803 RepID=A0A4Y2T9E3_ARAVE|nr:hypothetical protein AVEN_241034-1 [Araneus ventricosus]
MLYQFFNKLIRIPQPRAKQSSRKASNESSGNRRKSQSFDAVNPAIGKAISRSQNRSCPSPVTQPCSSAAKDADVRELVSPAVSKKTNSLAEQNFQPDLHLRCRMEPKSASPPNFPITAQVKPSGLRKPTQPAL